MEQELIRKIFHIDGMTCTGCETRIENVLKKLDGVHEVKGVYSNSKVYVTYDNSLVSLDTIKESIEKLDYKVIDEIENVNEKNNVNPQKEVKFGAGQFVGIAIIILALYMIIKNTIGFNFIPQVDQSMGYGILFVVGVLTSLHCIAMCGGINLSVCMQWDSPREEACSDRTKIASLKPGILYNLGRVISYTAIGGIVGALGSAVSFSGTTKGIVAILSGIFMVIMGLNMLNIFPWLRKLNPRMPKFLTKGIHQNNKNRGPLFVGLLNGLMPCGPLQAMQLYALGTGSFVAGALSMFLFSIGTVPLMFGFGALSSLMSNKFTHKMMRVSAILVVVLGVIMLNRGMALSGYGIDISSTTQPTASGIAKVHGNVQTVSIKLESGRYSPIVVQKGVPVKWTITATKEDLNGCNNRINVPEYGIENKQLVPGDNVIEFIPDKEGNFIYTCWMGMIRSNIKVVSNVSKASNADVQQSSDKNTPQGAIGGGCCGASAKATKFAGGRIPIDEVQVAEVKNGTQEVTVKVNDYGYSPAVVVVQKGVKLRIKFDTEQLNSCNNVVMFPSFNGQLDLQSQKETPEIIPKTDFTFQCWMGMLHGYVKVVDDVKKINLDDIKKEVDNYTPPAGVGGGGCCGG